jgi:hypothetical protein
MLFTRSQSLGVALRTEPVDFAAAINPVVAIVAAGQPFDLAVLVTGQHSYNLPVALINPVWPEVYFFFCHPSLCTSHKSKGSEDAVLHCSWPKPRAGKIAGARMSACGL